MDSEGRWILNEDNYEIISDGQKSCKQEEIPGKELGVT